MRDRVFPRTARARTALALLTVLALAACGTPRQVRDLSTTQLATLTAMETAVGAQGQALVRHADQLRLQRKARFEAELACADARFYVAAGVLSPASDNHCDNPSDGPGGVALDDETARFAIEQHNLGRAGILANIAALDTLHARIVAKSAELDALMDEVVAAQALLNTHIQTPTALERITDRIVDADTIAALTERLARIRAEAGSTADDIQALLDSMVAPNPAREVTPDD